MNFDTQIEKMKDDMIEATRRLIQIRSIQGEPEGEMPYGKGMDDAINYLLSLAAGMGFKTKKIDGYCGYAEYG
ncbi:MAG TPA: dipeptidase PepV, partial [Candidatus Copromorpha excrementavium]|nr:dipeptidase PepV [Candidatus Copromorpha excrementavium]